MKVLLQVNTGKIDKTDFGKLTEEGMNKSMKICVCVCVCLCLFFQGCGQQLDKDEKETKEEKSKIQIGFSINSLVLERWQKDRDIFTSEAQSLGAEVNVQNANGNVEEQISQVEYFIQKQMDAIVIIPGDKNDMTDVVNQAKDAGIPVISYDRVIANADVDLHISFDNQSVGSFMAEGLMQNIPDGSEIFMIQGPLEDYNVTLVREGFDKKIKEGKSNVVFETNCDGWIPENIADEVYSALQKYPNVGGIMCGNDELAGKVFQILAEKQLAGKVALVGQDGDLAACQRVVEGYQNMTVFKDINDMAKKAAQYAVKLAKEDRGRALTMEKTISDGSYEVPYLEIPVIAVKKENIDEIIIQGGFHVKNDVYLNVNEKE